MAAPILSQTIRTKWPLQLSQTTWTKWPPRMGQATRAKWSLPNGPDYTNHLALLTAWVNTHKVISISSSGSRSASRQFWPERDDQGRNPQHPTMCLPSLTQGNCYQRDPVSVGTGERLAHWPPLTTQQLPTCKRFLERRVYHIRPSSKDRCLRGGSLIDCGRQWFSMT